MKSKELLKGVLTAFAVLLAALVLGTMLMTAVYVLPTGRMLTNVDKSFESIDMEGGSFTWAPGYPGSRLDGYTDNIMLQTAVYQGSEGALREAMLNRRMNFPKAQLSPGNALINYVYGARNGVTESYGRYWHGYLLFLKPLLLFFSLSDIRMFLMLIQWSFMALLLVCAYRRAGARLVIPLGTAILCLNPVSTAMSMQYSSIYLLMLVFSLIELHLDSFSRARGWLLYLVLGILTAFFDFLTYPPVAFGICIALEVLVSKGNGKEKCLGLLRSGLSWGFGYAGMWSGKWLLGSLLTGQNILRDAMQSVEYRSGTQVTAAEGTADTSFFQVLSKNLGVYLGSAYLLLFALLLGVLLWLLLSKRNRFAPDRSSLAALGLIALVPFIWYFALQNHSSVHYWMTYRNLSITVMAVTAFFGFSLQKIGGTEHG